MKAGERIGHYEILAPIGRGGMGEVFRARDTKLKREVAIKILPPELAREPDRVARLEREATLLAALNHPNIAAIHGLEEHADGRFLVLELIEGDTLADRLRHGPLAAREAIEIALQLATALEAAHEKGVVHRDLKPANIMITPEGRVKVLDFGLAKTLVPAVGDLAGQTAVRTELGVVMGTAPYMSPEQARGASAGRQTDIWSFGAVLYEMLTGASPFARDTGAETLARVLEAQPDYAVLPAAVPANVQRLIRRCLEKDVRRRFRDMGDVCIELEEGRASQLSGESAPKTQSRAAAFLTPALVLLAIGFAVVAWTFGRPSATPIAPVVRFEVSTPPTDDATSFALSPDGRHLVFVADAPDGQDAQLWLRSLDQPSIRALPGTEGATFPFWKADGRQIGFFGGGRLKRIELDGGVVQDITEVLAARGGTWNATDDIVYATANTDDLHRVPASGGSSSVLLSTVGGQAGVGLRWPQFFPDGRRFLFYSYLGGEDVQGTYVGFLAGADPVRVRLSESGGAFVPPAHLLLARQGQLVAFELDPERFTITGGGVRIVDAVGSDDAYRRAAFSASWTGVVASRAGGVAQRRQLVWFDPGTGTSNAVAPLDVVGQAHPDLDRDGRRVAINRTFEGNIDIYVVDVARGGAELRLTTEPSSEGGALWSPDGSRVVFNSNRNGAYDLFERPARPGGEERALIVTGSSKVALSWSSNGRFLLYQERGEGTRNDLWVLPLDPQGNPEAPFLVVTSPYDETEGQFSPDGRWVAYASTQSGRQEIYVLPFPGPPGPREVVPVSAGGGTQVRWSPDGKILYYVTPDGRMMAVTHTEGPEATLFEAQAPQPLFSTRLARGINIASTRPQYAVARDGRFLMNVRVADPAPPPITILQNWTALLNDDVGN